MQDENDPLFAHSIFANYPIGVHIPKKKSIAASLQGLDPQVPYQIFLTKTTNFKISDQDIAEALEWINIYNFDLFVHTPYLLNLCLTPSDDNYVVNALREHLSAASAMGMKGVVVHVGKSVDTPIETALANMRTNLIASLTTATAECPLLLETPAGQGTELLTDMKEFMDFVADINDPRLRVCIDTCHVFAAGISPISYLENTWKNDMWRPLLKLIHFNDSKVECGKCVDRHAVLGMGYIGQECLIACAKFAARNKIPMLFE